MKNYIDLLYTKSTNEILKDKIKIKEEINELQKWSNILHHGKINYVPIVFEEKIYRIDRNLLNVQKITGSIINNTNKDLQKKKKILAIINAYLKVIEQNN